MVAGLWVIWGTEIKKPHIKMQGGFYQLTAFRLVRRARKKE
jgi:hypothetical protein